MKKIRISFQSLFENNHFVQIFSILAAIVAWFAVMISLKPESNVVINNVPVTINYEGSIPQSLGLQQIGDSEIMVTVYVTGKSSKFHRLTADDFSASISLNSVNKAQSYTLPIEVTKKDNDPDYRITGISESTATLTFDKIVSEQFTLEIQTPNLSAADGYIMQQPYANEENILVTGPQTLVERIASCSVTVDTEDKNMTDSLQLTASPVLLDRNGAPVSSEYLTVEPGNVEITIPIYKTKEMALSVEFVNTPKGFPLDELEYTLSQDTILVAAAPDIIDNQDEIVIGPIDFRSIDIGREFTLDVTLPAGFTNMESVASVTVTFPQDGFTARTYSIPQSNFVLENLPAGYDVSIVPQALSNVKIVGEDSVMETLSADDLVVTVDLSQVTLEKGQYTISARVYCQDGVLAWAVGDYTTTVNLTAK